MMQQRSLTSLSVRSKARSIVRAWQLCDISWTVPRLLGKRLSRVPRMDRLRWGAATITALFFGVMGTQFVLTQWIQGPQHHGALAAGLYFVPTALTALVFSLLSPGWAARRG